MSTASLLKAKQRRRKVVIYATKAGLKTATRRKRPSLVPVCVPKTLSALISRRNHLTSVDHVRTVLFRPGRFGLAVQVEEPTLGRECGAPTLVGRIAA